MVHVLLKVSRLLHAGELRFSVHGHEQLHTTVELLQAAVAESQGLDLALRHACILMSYFQVRTVHDVATRSDLCVHLAFTYALICANKYDDLHSEVKEPHKSVYTKTQPSILHALRIGQYSSICTSCSCACVYVYRANL
jgi:hypothetical protein